LLNALNEGEAAYHLKQINERCIDEGSKDCTLNRLKTIINFWSIKNWIKKQNLEFSKHHVNIAVILSKTDFQKKLEKRHFLSKLITEYLYEKSVEIKPTDTITEDLLIEFSVHELKEMALA